MISGAREAQKQTSPMMSDEHEKRRTRLVFCLLTAFLLNNFPLQLAVLE